MMAPSLLLATSTPTQMDHFIARPLERTIETQGLHILVFCILLSPLPSDISYHDSVETSVAKSPTDLHVSKPSGQPWSSHHSALDSMTQLIIFLGLASLTPDSWFSRYVTGKLSVSFTSSSFFA